MCFFLYSFQIDRPVLFSAGFVETKYKLCDQFKFDVTTEVKVSWKYRKEKEQWRKGQEKSLSPDLNLFCEAKREYKNEEINLRSF